MAGRKTEKTREQRLAEWIATADEILKELPPIPKKRGGSKKGKYNSQTVGIILAALEEGHHQLTACSLAGISTTAFHEWINEKPEFSTLVKEAESKAISQWLGHINQQAPSDWRAAAWLMERRTDQWARREKVDLTSDGKQIEFTITMGKDLSSATDDDA